MPWTQHPDPDAATATHEVIAVRYATRVATRAEVFHGDAGPEGDAAMAMDYFFWVLRGAAGGVIVVDSGFRREVGAAMGRTMLVEPGVALRRLGITPSEVQTVVITHLHYDHIGNLDLFPGARLVVAAADLDFWSGPLDEWPQFRPYVRAEEVARVQEAVTEGRVQLVEDALEVAPGVRALRVGGHSPGQLVLVVETEAGDVVLASDAVHYYEELEHGRPFALFVDLAETRAAYDTVRELVAGGDRLLVAGHDPLVAQRFPVIPGDHEFALRIAPRAPSGARRAVSGETQRDAGPARAPGTGHTTTTGATA